MNQSDLERFLEKGYLLGFTKETNHPDFVGWILLSKQKVDYRYLSLLDDGEDPVFRNKQKEIEENPYIVRVFEMKKSVYDAQVYEKPEDYRENNRYRFSNLQDVAEFLSKYDKKLSDIKWLSEINAS